jgi:ribosomal protein L14E/L6E/L27E
MKLGTYVCSTRGRDACKCFLVVGILDEAFVLIADGKCHKVDKPKKKKIKHLTILGDGDESINAKLQNKEAVTNKQVYGAIKKLNAKNGEE